eukprot:12634487-Alexandrium_andersonii.AAC.1
MCIRDSSRPPHKQAFDLSPSALSTGGLRSSLKGLAEGLLGPTGGSGGRRARRVSETSPLASCPGG